MKKAWALLCLLLTLSCNKSNSNKSFVSIGTGGVTGVYYPVGGALARMLNKYSNGEIKASAESTDGSVYNINAILNGDLQFGIAQSDRQYQAVNGIAEWSKDNANTEKTKKLRAVIGLHNEAMTFLMAADTKITNIKELKGKNSLRINIGAMGSGVRENALDVFEHFGIKPDVDFKPEGLKSSESSSLLQDNRIDGFLFTVGHPSGAFMEATNGTREARFISLSDSTLDSLIKKYPYYAKTTIPIKDYPQAVNKEDVATVGVVATLVSSTDVDSKIVYMLVKSIMENFDEFKTIHPSLSQLKKEEVLQGLSAPLHEGAKKYFQEIGLIK